MQPNTTQNTTRSDLLVWVDLEMTGLNPKVDVITEIATIITDSDLNVIAEGPELVIKIEDLALRERTFARTDFVIDPALAAAITTSNVTMAEAQRQTLDFIAQYVEKNSSPLCGNSIHTDRYFLIEHMPGIINHLHYRNIDVSSVKELARRWKPEVFEQACAQKKGVHRAKDDILESIAELKFYREHFFSAPYFVLP